MQLKRDERGLTLVELVVAIAIMGIIVVPLGNAMIVFFRNSNDTSARLSESHDVQIASAYFSQDVQATGVHDWAAYPFSLKQSIETNISAGSGLWPCGTPGTTPDAIIRFAWDDPTSATGSPSVVRSAYFIKTVGGETQLRRISCAGANAPVEIVLVHNIVTALPQCFNPTTCTTAAVPQSVTLTLTIKDPADTGTGLSIVLNGQRRQT
jgi:prepilin-type N-terminal cleavage/methylation domain-containing protein